MFYYHSCYVARILEKVALYDVHIQFLQCACNRDLNKPKYQHLGGSSVRCNTSNFRVTNGTVQLFTFSNARDDLRIVFHPHSNVNLENRITGATRITSSAVYRCYVNDGVAGCPTWLISTIRLLQPLILCSFFTGLATHRS
ncbi:hypothetical protein T09_15009 [Trichinella sp. T9]|nr:hypothetical protein T09_15009 [Trichinella sp. T9]